MNDRGSHEGFLTRWARRKARSRHAPEPAEPRTDGAAEAIAARAPSAASAERPAVERVEPPPPTLADAAALTPESDFARFVAGGVEPDVKNAALKKLFADPRFNEMDGLDTYVDDYTRPDPIPASVLARLAHAQAVDPGAQHAAAAPAETGVVTRAADDGETPAAASDDSVPKMASDENADLRLQPHDAARCAGAEPGTDGDGGSEQRRAG